MRSAEFSVLPFAAIDHDRSEDCFCGVEGRASFALRARVEAEVTGAASVNVVNEDGGVVAAGALTLGTYLEEVEDGIFVPFWMVEILLDGMPFGLMSRPALGVGRRFYVAHRADWRRVAPPPGLPSGAWFGAGTMLVTEAGDQPVEWIEPGVQIATRDRGLQPVQHVMRYQLSQGATGVALADIPVSAMAQPGGSDALVVSRDSDVMLRSTASEAHFGAQDVFVSARVWQDGFALDPAPQTLTALVFRGHEVIETAAGVGVGSWRATPWAMACLTPMQQLSVLHAKGAVHTQILPARQVLTDEQADQIAPRRRHSGVHHLRQSA